MMRMKGHAIHDAAEYVPKPLFGLLDGRDPLRASKPIWCKEKVADGGGERKN